MFMIEDNDTPEELDKIDDDSSTQAPFFLSHTER